ncbi:MAG: S-layer y protein [Firmicutes bacterium]|nr:S-layer y protein [Bacillota bacterium]
MTWKKKTALLLAALLLMSCMPVGAVGSFHDINDTETARNVEILQMMDVINGISLNSFAPQGTLTRAQFTKMAIMVMGKGDQVSGYQSFTIFPDVKSSHWASGYVNLAVRGTLGEDGKTSTGRFIAGFADGTFGPDKTITYGEAITILMRLLGYTDKDVGIVWPTGYINAAKAIGLADGVSLGGGNSITRAQAAQLFVNLLGTTKKDSKETYGASVATPVENVTVLDAGAKDENGTPAIEVISKETGKSTPYPLANGIIPQLIQGRQGDLLLNGKGEVLTFVPDKVGYSVDFTVSSAKAGTIADTNGKEYTVNASTDTFYRGEKKTYGDVFVNLRSGTRVSLHFGANGKVDAVFVAAVSSEDTLVIRQNGSNVGLAAITGGRTDYKIIKNGETVAASDLKAYDVATYIAGENTIYISSLRLTGYYEKAYPTASAPSQVTLMGYEFDVLPNATASFSQFKVGDTITLLFTQDFKVAGAADPKDVRGTAMGIGTAKGGSATVALLDGITLKGKTSATASYDGELVTVTSSRSGEISLSPVRVGGTADSLNVAKRKLGSRDLAANVVILERVSTGAASRIGLEDIRMDVVPGIKIQLARINDAGKVDLLILDNVSGDSFIYGIAQIGKDTEQNLDGSTSEVNTMTLMYGEEKSVGPFYQTPLNQGTWGGIAVSGGTMTRIVTNVKLTKLASITNQQWLDEDTVLVNQQPYEVSDKVICYNRTSGLWITVGAARAFGERMTLYVDDFHVVRGIEVG